MTKLFLNPTYKIFYKILFHTSKSHSSLVHLDQIILIQV